jgi:hypothetical protein
LHTCGSTGGIGGLGSTEPLEETLKTVTDSLGAVKVETLTVFIVENLPSTALPIALSISLLALLSLADLAKVFWLWTKVTDRNKAAKIKEIMKIAAGCFNIANSGTRYIKFR